jgi:chemotaxis protein methyltransferase CheR
MTNVGNRQIARLPTRTFPIESPKMDAQQFQRFCDIAYSKAGIKLRDGKEALVSARVAKRLRALHLSSAGEYLALLEGDKTGNEIVSFLDAISTNFTTFFREPVHFETLKTFIEHRLSQGKKRLRVWCAASSSGEEPYTLAMTIAETLGQSALDWRILATDISTKILAVAEQGIYDAAALKDVPRAMLAKYFTSLDSKRSSNRRWQVTEELRRKVVFKRLNLAKPPYPMPGPLDVVFCRNVMIYFDDPVRQGLVSEIDRLLADDGLVCIGHSESFTGLRTQLTIIEPSVYQPRGTVSPLSLTKSAKRLRR